MADHDQTASGPAPLNISTPSPAWPNPATIRMGALVGGALGLLGFSLAVFCGLAAHNSLAEILTRSVFTSLVLLAVGSATGLIAGHLIAEHIQRQVALARQAEANARQAADDSPEADQATQATPASSQENSRKKA